jgi:hypothetical protein
MPSTWTSIKRDTGDFFGVTSDNNRRLNAKTDKKETKRAAAARKAGRKFTGPGLKEELLDNHRYSESTYRMPDNQLLTEEQRLTRQTYSRAAGGVVSAALLAAKAGAGLAAAASGPAALATAPTTGVIVGTATLGGKVYLSEQDDNRLERVRAELAYRRSKGPQRSQRLQSLPISRSDRNTDRAIGAAQPVAIEGLSEAIQERIRNDGLKATFDAIFNDTY